MAKEQMPKDPTIDALIRKADPLLDQLSHYITQMAIRWIQIDPRIRNQPVENAIAFFVTALATTVNDKAIDNLEVHEELMRTVGDIDPDKLAKALELMRFVDPTEKVISDIPTTLDAPKRKQ